ncbi:DUF4491 family protein [Brotaphodocola sp.]|uniref:DUF4491 family protein n=1 Tax=Brotaphodocola sp. TaxID=3073577 RepID=UPI003D7D2F23
MHVGGLLVGVFTFLIIGAFHGVVVKTEYYFSKRVWPIFLILGAIFLTLSLLIRDTALGSIVAVLGVTFLWSIKKLFEQERRVQKGWFPKNPNRKKR